MYLLDYSLTGPHNYSEHQKGYIAEIESARPDKRIIFTTFFMKSIDPPNAETLKITLIIKPVITVNINISSMTIL